MRRRVVLLVLVLLVGNTSPAWAVERLYSQAEEYGGNYGVSGRFGPGQPLACDGPGPGFVWHALWQDTSAGTEWIELGIERCLDGEKWKWARFQNAQYTELEIGEADASIEHTYKIYSHEDGKYRLFIDGAKVASIGGFGTTNYTLNSASAGMEVVDQQNSVLGGSPWKVLQMWVSRNTRSVWDGQDACIIDEPAGGKWSAVNRWRTDLNKPLADSAC